MTETTRNSPTDLGGMIDELADIRRKKRDLTEQLNELSEKYIELEAAIMRTLDSQGTQFAGSARNRATITESVVPNIEDWDQFEVFAINEGALHLFQRRVAVNAWRELHESGVTVPGTTPFTKRALSLRKSTN